jgi:hypothetical protein
MELQEGKLMELLPSFPQPKYIGVMLGKKQWLFTSKKKEKKREEDNNNIVVVFFAIRRDKRRQ